VLSEHTVHHHVTNILKKLNLSSRQQVASRLRDQSQHSLYFFVPFGRDSHFMAISGNGRLTTLLYAECTTLRATRKARRREMNTTIRGHDFRTIVALAALIVLVALVIVLRTTTPTGGGNPAIHARDTGGSSITQDPYNDRHAEVVARYHEGSRR